MPWKTPDRVKQTATTTGTGDFTLSGSITGSVNFSAVCTTGDTVPYVIQLVDGAGAPAAEWEVGHGTYSGANTLTRTSVLASSNAGALVNFSAGTKQVWIGFNGTMAGWVREKLSADRTYYVRSDGSDSNRGLTNTSGGAFLTIQKAVDVISGSIDMATYTVTVQCNDATRTEKVVLKSYIGANTPTIIGNTGTPANCTTNATSGDCFYNTSLKPWAVNGFKLTTTTSGFCLRASGGGSAITFSNIEFGASASTHIQAASFGIVTAATNYSISGGASSHFEINEGGTLITGGRTVTLTGTPAFSVAYAYGRKGHAVVNGMTFSGSATGPRLSLNLCSTIFSNGGAEATYFPGDSAGSKSTGSEWS